eukprot:m.20280 g.20280  ORF g.20280 m.20280 type:complete len:411 (+) comp6128_c1_seq1:139-1371(+)
MQLESASKTTTQAKTSTAEPKMGQSRRRGKLRKPLLAPTHLGFLLLVRFLLNFSRAHPVEVLVDVNQRLALAGVVISELIAPGHKCVLLNNVKIIEKHAQPQHKSFGKAEVMRKSLQSVDDQRLRLGVVMDVLDEQRCQIDHKCSFSFFFFFARGRLGCVVGDVAKNDCGKNKHKRRVLAHAFRQLFHELLGQGAHGGVRLAFRHLFPFGWNKFLQLFGQLLGDKQHGVEKLEVVLCEHFCTAALATQLGWQALVDKVALAGIEQLLELFLADDVLHRLQDLHVRLNVLAVEKAGRELLEGEEPVTDGVGKELAKVDASLWHINHYVLLRLQNQLDALFKVARAQQLLVVHGLVQRAEARAVLVLGHLHHHVCRLGNQVGHIAFWCAHFPDALAGLVHVDNGKVLGQQGL